MTIVHVVLPNDIDDPATPSGGNTYDRRICQGLVALGWSVVEHAVHGGWPRPAGTERAEVAELLSGVPDDAVVLLDGLIASAVPEVLGRQARRLRLVVLVHMPLGHRAEREALAAARAVIATSAWTDHRLPGVRTYVATPGVDPAEIVAGTDAGTELLCVAAVTPHKGHDLLAEALSKVADLDWACQCVGSLDRDAAFVDRLRAQLSAYGLAARVRLVGARVSDRLEATYAAADLLVLASRGETYGMVVTEALARGIPVLATAVGGVAEALGHAPGGSRPGVLVAPDDAAALADALRCWLTDADLRERLRRSARARRSTLTGWTVTAELISEVLDQV
jgi:glycosyltransferase involved in cell wall biosynthesis